MIYPTLLEVSTFLFITPFFCHLATSECPLPVTRIFAEACKRNMSCCVCIGALKTVVCHYVCIGLIFMCQKYTHGVYCQPIYGILWVPMHGTIIIIVQYDNNILRNGCYSVKCFMSPGSQSDTCHHQRAGRGLASEAGRQGLRVSTQLSSDLSCPTTTTVVVCCRSCELPQRTRTVARC